MVNVYNGERVQKLNTQCCPCSAKRHSLHAEKQNILFQEYLESKVCGTKGFKNTAANMWWMSCWGMNRCQVWNRKASPFLAPLTRWMGQAYNEISLERTLLVSWAVTCELTNSDVKGNRMRQEVLVKGKPRAFVPLWEVWWRPWWHRLLMGINPGRCQTEDKVRARCG